MEISYRGNVAQLIFLTSQNLSQDTAHDLAASCLGQIWYNVHCLGSSKWANAPTHLHDELFAQCLAGGMALLESHKGIHSLASELIGHANDSSLGNNVMFDEGGLNFRGRETVTTDVDDIIDTSPDPVEALVVSTGAITGELKRKKRCQNIETNQQKIQRDDDWSYSRKVPCTRSCKCPCSACERHRRYGPCSAMAA